MNSPKKSLQKSGSELYVMGLNAIIENEKELGVKLLSEAVEIDSGLIDAYYHLGKLYAEKGELIRAQKIFRDLLLRPNIPQEFRLKVEGALIHAYTESKNYAQAQEIAEMRVLKYPEDTEIRLLLTTLLERQKNFTLAAGHWKIYTKLSKTNGQHRLSLYEVETARADKSLDLKSKKKLYAKAIKTDPKCAAAYVMLARAYREEKNPDKVLDIWSEFLDQVPSRFSWIYSELEEYLYEINRYHELVGIYQKLVRQPGSHRYLAHLALLRQYLKMGQRKEAMELFKQLKSEKPDEHNSLKEFMRYSLQIQGKDAAISEFNSIMSHMSDVLSYSCQECGQKAKEPEWYCQNCGAWESFSF